MTSPRQNRVDAHHHLWSYNPAEYGWISDDMDLLRRDFRPEHFKEEIDDVGIGGAVTVQARQSLAETDWLLELAGAYGFIRGVVGWAPLVDPHVPRLLERYAANAKLKGVRHSLQDEPDDRYMLRDDFNRGVAALAPLGLVYDILILDHQLPTTISFVDRHPQQVFVLDHLAKPRVRDAALSPWSENLKELARRPNVYCKLSGLVTEAPWRGWREADLRPYLDAAIEAFGAERLMFGSDWPVSRLACEYRRWFNIVNRAVAGLTEMERARVFGGTAIEVYRLERTSRDTD